MIGIVDYGMGNLRSVEKALHQVGGETRFISRPEDTHGLTGIVLPGVGAFADCVTNLRGTGLWQFLKDWIAEDKPFFGICLGYQALFTSSEEGPGEGLDVFKGEVVRFTNPALKVPQIGWNSVAIAQPTRFTEGLEDGAYVYFVHSFYPVPADKSIVALRTNYGVDFAAAVTKGNLFATQFHPEKSQAVGLKLLGNFVGVCGGKPVVAAQGELVAAR